MVSRTRWRGLIFRLKTIWLIVGHCSPMIWAAFLGVTQPASSSTSSMFLLVLRSLAISVILSVWLWRLGHLPAYEYSIASILLKVVGFTVSILSFGGLGTNWSCSSHNWSPGRLFAEVMARGWC